MGVKKTAAAPARSPAVISVAHRSPRSRRPRCLRCRRDARRHGKRTWRCPHRTAHDQDADAPPSTGSTWPLTCLEASLARKTTAPFKSSLLPRRPSGVRAMTASPMSSSKPADIFDGKNPGQIALTLMPYGPHSQARVRVKLMSAAFEVL